MGKVVQTTSTRVEVPLGRPVAPRVRGRYIRHRGGFGRDTGCPTRARDTDLLSEGIVGNYRTFGGSARPSAH